MAVQERFEALDVILVDGALRENHDVDTARLLAGGDEHAIQEVQVDAFIGRELEKVVGLLRQSLHGAFDRMEVRRPHAQRPREQQQVRVLGPGVGTAMTTGRLVPASVYARAVHTGIA